MKGLTPADANRYFREVSLRLDDWGRVQPTREVPSGSAPSIHAPRSTREAVHFARHIAAWVTPGLWKILQFDNSNNFDAAESVTAARLLTGTLNLEAVRVHRTWLFEFGPDSAANAKLELLLTELIEFVLRCEGHGYVVSSDGHGAYLALQDGFVYFHGPEASQESANALIRHVQTEPSRSPASFALLADALDRSDHR